MAPGSPRFELGLQQKEDVVHRLLDIWATGEASASLGFQAARLFDELDPIEKGKDKVLAAAGVTGSMAAFKFLKRKQSAAIAALKTGTDDPILQYLILDAQANVLCPACKLWNTGHGANTMREAVSLMGGYGITEDCPGFLGYKWMDAQLEATYEGPEAVQRRQLTVTMTNEIFLQQYKTWIGDMRKIASRRPGTGACTLASAMELWLWSLHHLQQIKLFQGSRQAITFPMADALCWLLASRAQILDVEQLRLKGAEDPGAAEGLEGTVQFLTDLCHIQAARAAGEVNRICSELVFGHRVHPSWEGSGQSCYQEEELITLESIVPGASGFTSDFVHEDGHVPVKAGPCVDMSGLSDFNRLSTKLHGCMSGFMIAKDRAAQSLQKVMIPAALDYPA